MPLDLNGRLFSDELWRLLDERMLRVVRAEQTRLVRGRVASVDVSSRIATASVWLEGEDRPSPGILVTDHLPEPNDDVIVSIGSVRSRRAVEHVLGHAINPRTRVIWQPVDPHIQVVTDGSTTTTAIAKTTTRELTELPMHGVVAVLGTVHARDSVTSSAANRTVEVYHYSGGLAGGANIDPTALMFNMGMFVAATGGQNDRQFRYAIPVAPVGTITYYIRVTGYLTTEEPHMATMG
jgi:hypothetical protein